MHKCLAVVRGKRDARRLSKVARAYLAVRGGRVAYVAIRCSRSETDWDFEVSQHLRPSSVGLSIDVVKLASSFRLPALALASSFRLPLLKQSSEAARVSMFHWSPWSICCACFKFQRNTVIFNFYARWSAKQARLVSPCSTSVPSCGGKTNFRNNGPRRRRLLFLPLPLLPAVWSEAAPSLRTRGLYF